MTTVGFLLHQERSEALRLFAKASSWLDERGHEATLIQADPRLDDLVVAAAVPDVVVSLGGDGTMLRAVDLVGNQEVPVIGVNLGHLGYLSEVDPAHLTEALERFLDGKYEIEERMRMAVQVEAPSFQRHVGGGNPPVFPALNEAVVGKTPSGQIVWVEVSVDGEVFTTYRCDGVIIATPTGSTAYAWSARGPIVEPLHSALLLIPVAPHMLFDRSMVLPPEACIRLEVAPDRVAALSVDGRNLGELQPGDAIVCTRAVAPARFVTFGPRNFLRILKAKFGLDAANTDR